MASSLDPLAEIDYRACYLQQRLRDGRVPKAELLEELDGINQAVGRAKADLARIDAGLARIGRIGQAVVGMLGPERPTLVLIEGGPVDAS